ncbi:MAG: hypothetical protein IPH37_19960 [Burkholderiales bacterium]|nr:hypothetical protein [Burkholderiales bacterium]
MNLSGTPSPQFSLNLRGDVISPPPAPLSTVSGALIGLGTAYADGIAIDVSEAVPLTVLNVTVVHAVRQQRSE